MTGGMLLTLIKTSAKLAPSVKHQEVLDSHFTTDDNKKWRTFKRALRSKKFAEAVSQDDRADPKLRRFATMLSKHYNDKDSSFTVVGNNGKYTVRFHKDINRYSCSCPDWTYTKSHKDSNTADCKHITEIRNTVKSSIDKTAGIGTRAIGLLGTKVKAENADDEAWRARMASNTVRRAFPKHAEIRGRAAEAVLAAMKD